VEGIKYVCTGTNSITTTKEGIRCEKERCLGQSIEEVARAMIRIFKEASRRISTKEHGTEWEEKITSQRDNAGLSLVLKYGEKEA